jgi:hypothetical protein
MCFKGEGHRNQARALESGAGGNPFESNGDNLSLMARLKMDPRLREDDSMSGTDFLHLREQFLPAKFGRSPLGC